MAAKRGPKQIGTERYAQALKEAHGNISLAARKLGVERRAVQYAIEQHPTVRQAHDEAADVVTDVAEGHLVKGVMNGQWEQVRYWLEQKARGRGYGRPQQHEITGRDGAPIALSVFSHGAAAAALAARSGAYRDPPGADEGGSDGT